MKKANMFGIAIGSGALALVSGGVAITYAKDRKPPVEMRAVGDAKNCVDTRSIMSTKIVDNMTIDFKMTRGKTLRNTLSYSCPGLKSEDRFSYRTTNGQLCNVDIIYVLRIHGGDLQRGAGCGLGKFQPVEPVIPAS